ncbi:MAG: EscU/YscU/HrcU family type III secretion system export apparatus switch protein [Candidatus Hydrogenedentota bacterium]
MSAKQAIAVRYDSTKETAPRVVAKGRGHIAEKILEIARTNNVPVHEDRELVEMLTLVELFDEIPPELYTAVAEVLVWVYKVNNENKSGGGISS